MKNDYPLTQGEFETIYAKVPRLTVELILRAEKGVLMTLRAIEPCAGTWHLPGGTVYYGEPLQDAVKRVGLKELNITVKTMKQIGIIEYPDHVLSGYGDPRGVAYLIESYDGVLKTDAEAEKFDYFKSEPKNMHPNQGDFLRAVDLIT